MIAKRQHWVPRFLLRNFTEKPKDKNPQIEVYDLNANKTFKTPIMNVAQEKHFYNTQQRGAAHETLETWLCTHVEDPAAPVLESLLQLRSVLGLSDTERLALARLVVTLAVRVRRTRTEIAEFPKALLDFFDSHGETLIPELRREIEADADSTAIHNGVIEDIAKIAPDVARMSWRLVSPPAGREFCSSDNPVLRFNELDADPYGNLGLLCRGIQLHLALAPDLLLLLVDPDIYGPSSDDIAVGQEPNLLAYNASLAAEATQFLFSRSGDFDVRPNMRTGSRRILIGR
jgi:hypothetical protein